MKFGRIFSMSAEGNSGTRHIIASPLTCRLRVSNTGTPSASLAAFQIYNLTSDVRNDIFKDDFQQFIYRQLVFSAGYQTEPSIPIIFQGNILRAFSYRQGPDWVTQIECLDGGYGIENGVINLTVPTPYNFEDVFTRVVAGMPKVKLGIMGSFDITNSRGITYSGNPWDLLVRQILPLEGQLYIDREIVNVVQQREYIVRSAALDEISDDTGLLDTPRRQEAMIRCRMLFEPRFEMMQKVTVKSAVPGNNGDYKIMRIDHVGTISGAVCESLTTEVTALGPSRELEAVA